jgi:hypothetical protein
MIYYDAKVKKTFFGKTGGGILKTARIGQLPHKGMWNGVWTIFVEIPPFGQFLAYPTILGNLCIDGVVYKHISLSQRAYKKLEALEAEIKTRNSQKG